MPGEAAGPGSDQARGAQVIAAVNAIRDEIFPLATGAYSDSVGFAVMDGLLEVTLADGPGPGQPALSSARLLRQDVR